MRTDPEFLNGAMNRRLGQTKTQSAKHLKCRGGHDAWAANRMGWAAMDQYLCMKEIDLEVSKGERQQ